MRTVKYHFYVSGDYDKGWVSPLIGQIGYIANKKDCDRLLGGKVLISHEEIEFCDRLFCGCTGSKCPGYITHNNLAIHSFGQGICFSSATRGGKTGVRFAPSNEVVGKNPERWITITVNLPDEVEEAMWQAAKSIKGAGYDYIGVLFKTTPITDFLQINGWWYCSECVNWIASRSVDAWDDLFLNKAKGYDTFEYSEDFLRWRRCFESHRRLSPLANLLMMMKAGYKTERRAA